ncbi:hypothetical protein JCM8097_008063 [Rhodosporidiobolus ruineniae]
MTGRARLARTAASTVEYTSKAYDALGSSEEDAEEQELMRTRGKRKGVGRGKGRTVYFESTDSDEEEVAPKKRSRKRKPAAPKGSKKLKRKDYLRLLPTEILCEIFSYFHPGELLTFRLTSKTNATLLSVKSSAPIWRKARQRMQLEDVEGISEIRYAQLAFGKECEVCGSTQKALASWYFMNLLCRRCRDELYVKITSGFEKQHPELHPLASQVVRLSKLTPLSSSHSPMDLTSIGCLADSPAGPTVSDSEDYRYAMRDELQHYSDKLLELEVEDHRDVVYPEMATTRAQQFVRSRQQEVRNALQLGDDLGSPSSRKSLSKMVLRDSARTAHEQKRLIRARKADPPVRSEFSKRLAAEENFPPLFFLQEVWRRSKYSRYTRLSDEVYEELKPKALNVTVRIRAACQAVEEKADILGALREAKDARISHLRPRFDKLRSDEPDEHTRLLYPIFAVFSTFESVQALLPQRKLPHDFDPELTDEVWDEALPLIKDELEQYRLDLFLHAIKLILRATTDDELPEDDDLLANLEQYNDAFFAKATSFLCCSFPCCHRTSPFDRLTFVGSFFSLLAHQHEDHASETWLIRPPRKRSVRVQPLLPIDLPLEVACAVSALVELGDLDDATAGKADLDEVDRAGRYEWENRVLDRRYFTAWRDLLDAVYRAAAKAARAGPDHCLPPPTIVYRKNRLQAEAPQLFTVLASSPDLDSDDSMGRSAGDHSDEDSEGEEGKD